MRSAMICSVSTVAAVLLAGCGPVRPAPSDRPEGGTAAATQPAADAVIHINGLSCPF